MAEEIGSIFWRVGIVGNDKARKELKETGSDLKKTAGHADTAHKSTQNLRLGLLAGGAAAIAFGRSCVQAFNEANAASSRLSTNLLNVKGNTEKNVTAITNLAKAMQQKGVIDDDAIVTGASQLATFNLQGKTIEMLTPKIADMVAQLKGANATSEDMVSINNLIGKAMTGNAGALGKYGVTLSDVQKEQIKNGTETERAATMVEVLSQNYGEVNKALGKLPLGKLTQLKNAFNDVQEVVGETLLGLAMPALTKLAGHTDEVGETVIALAQAFGAFGGAFADAVIPVIGLIKPLLPLLKGFSNAVGAIPPQFIVLAAGAALLAKGLDKITLPTRGATASLQQHQNALGQTQGKWSLMNQTFFHSGDNIKTIGAHMGQLTSSAGQASSGFGVAMGKMATGAQTAGRNIMNALGGPMGIGLLAGTFAITKIVSTMEEAKAKAKALKTEAKDVAKEMQFSTVASSGLQQVVLILDALVKKGGEAAKQIAKIKGMTTSEIGEAISSGTINDQIKALDKKASYLSGSGVNAKFSRLTRFSWNDGDKADAEKQATALKKTRDAVIATQKDIFKSNSELAKSLKRDDIAKVFDSQAKLLKGGKFEEAYVASTIATQKLNVEQAKITDNATRASLGLDKLSGAAKTNTQAMTEGASAASDILDKLTGVAEAISGGTTDSAFASNTQSNLAYFASMYVEATKVSSDAANTYALQVTESLGLTEEKSVEVAQKLSELGAAQAHGYSTFLTDTVGAFIPLDEALADKMEVKAGGPTAQVYLNNLKTLDTINSEFMANVDFLYQAGYHELATQLSAAGSKAAGATAADYVKIAKSNDASMALAANESVKNAKGKFSDPISKAYADEAARLSGQSFDVNPTIKINPKMKSQDFVLHVGGGLNVRAKGGPVRSGIPYLVGEEGPELFTPQGNGNIIPAGQTSRMLGQASSQLSGQMGTVINITADMSGIMATSKTHQLEVVSALLETANDDLMSRGFSSEIIGGNKLRAAR